jgi:acetyltransferase
MSANSIRTSSRKAANTNAQSLMFATESERVRLNDARRVTIRPILPSDVDALRTFFVVLSHATLRLRFHFSLQEPSECILHEFTAIDHRDHVAFVAEAHDTAVDQSPTIVGEARYVRYPKSDSAEFALVVAEAWRRIGLGTSLALTLVRHARLAGVRRLCGDVLYENQAMRGFAHSLSARSRPQTAGAGTVRLCRDV